MVFYRRYCLRKGECSIGARFIYFTSMVYIRQYRSLLLTFRKTWYIVTCINKRIEITEYNEKREEHGGHVITGQANVRQTKGRKYEQQGNTRIH